MLPPAPKSELHTFYFHCALWVCHPNTRIYVRLLGPCFKTGQLRPFCQDLDCTWTLPNRDARPRGAACCSLRDGTAVNGRPAIERAINSSVQTTTLPEKPPEGLLSQASLAARALILTIRQTQCRLQIGIGRMPTRTTDLNRFPFSNFKYFLTLFSKFFSSFPHGTCSLSVSRQYLALDGIYHPFRAAFPSNSTL